MVNIEEKVLARIEEKGVLTSRVLSDIFRDYDELVFGGEIKSELRRANARIGFILDTKRKDDGTVEYRDGVYFLVFGRNNIMREDVARNVSLSMEYNIIHLLMLLYGYLDRKPTKVFEIYGMLYNCASKRIFDHGKLIPVGYDWKGNSCYFDSLLSIIVLTDNSIWRDVIMYSDVDRIVYTSEDILKLNKQEHELRKLSKGIQIAMLTEYKALINGEEVCTDMRKYTSKILVEYGLSDTGEPQAVYDVFVDLFPRLRTQIVEQTYDVKDGQNIPRGAPRANEVNMLSIDRYVEETATTKTYSSILWEKYDSPYIVFFSLSQYASFNVLGTQGDLRIQRVLEEYILDNRYRLLGVTISSGAHYTSLLRRINKWYTYNDLRTPKLEPLIEFPTKLAFTQEGGRRPTMFFYERV